jgi:hypothetical protein
MRKENKKIETGRAQQKQADYLRKNQKNTFVYACV